MKIEVGKFYKTRDGRKARIYATDGISDTLHGAILHEGGWVSYAWHESGLHYLNTREGTDLVSEWREPVKLEFEAKAFVNDEEDRTCIAVPSSCGNKTFKITLEEIV